MSLVEPTAAGLRTRADLTADRLMATQHSDGYFLYKFHPVTGRKEGGPGNLVRQAGCAYALGRAADQAAEPSRRDDLAASASRAIDALLDRVVTESGTSFIAELPQKGVPVRGKLGTLALTLSAVQSASLADRYPAERESLVDAVLSLQRPDGSFRCRTDSLSAADDGASQDYFPGEALMALSAEVARGATDCSRAHRAMAAAFPWYTARFRAQPSTAFVPWQLEAWRVYAQWSMRIGAPTVPDLAACAGFVFEMADWLLEFQIGQAAGNADLIGGFAKPGRKPGASTASSTEAMIRAFSLAASLADSGRASRYREASLLGLDFLQRLQVTPEAGHAFPDPVLTVGGTPASPHNPTIRCDYDQHSLIAYLAAIQTSNLLAA